MSKKYSTTTTLLIVESPAKCKKIEGFLGPGYKCLASFGHLRELSSLNNINLEDNFRPTFKVIDNSLKKKQIDLLRKEISRADEVILATDDDREGEGISFHIKELFKLPENTKRIVFNEITESAIKNALNNPRRIDMNIELKKASKSITLEILSSFYDIDIQTIEEICKMNNYCISDYLYTPAYIINICQSNMNNIEKTLSILV